MDVETEKNDRYWKLLRYEVQVRRIQEAFALFRKNGFEPILIKGWAANQNYAKPYERWSLDTDLAVDPKDYFDCQKLIKEKKIFDIDLHCGLRHHDTVDWENLYENSRLVELGETEIRILRAEDHLRVLCVHWLTDGGAHKERLWDIYWAVQNRPPDFDWERCLNLVSERRRKWVICAISLAHRYLGLDLSETPLKDKSGEIPRWVVKAIEREWASGTKLRPLRNCLNDRKEFFIQIKKRLPPNPITATVDMEGDFDEKPRIFYQAGDIIFRLKPSILRIAKTLFSTEK